MQLQPQVWQGNVIAAPQILDLLSYPGTLECPGTPCNTVMVTGPKVAHPVGLGAPTKAIHLTLCSSAFCPSTCKITSTQ